MKREPPPPPPNPEYAWAKKADALDPKDVDLAEITKYFKSFKHDLVDQGELQEVGEDHDYLRTWRLHAPDVWQQCAIVVFPYTNEPWSRLIFEWFRNEGYRWRRWCSADDGSRRSNDGVEIVPLWSGL